MLSAREQVTGAAKGPVWSSRSAKNFSWRLGTVPLQVHQFLNPVPGQPAAFADSRLSTVCPLPLLPGELGMGPGARSGPTHRTRQKLAKSVRPQEGRQEHHGNAANGDKAPHLPRAASLLSEVGGAGAPWKCAFWQLPHPRSTPLSKGSVQKGAIWSFVDTFSPVQYGQGVHAGPGSPAAAVPPHPHGPCPHRRLESRGAQSPAELG